MTAPGTPAPMDPTLTGASGTGVPALLELVLPDDLPAALFPQSVHRHQMQTLLRQVLYALDLDDPGLRLRHLNAILHDLPPSDPGDTTALDAHPPVKPDQVREFDRYFCVSRIRTHDPAIPLLRGLLQSCVAVLALCNRTDALPAGHVARQIDGFRAHARTLERCLGAIDPK